MASRGLWSSILHSRLHSKLHQRTTTPSIADWSLPAAHPPDQLPRCMERFKLSQPLIIWGGKASDLTQKEITYNLSLQAPRSATAFFRWAISKQRAEIWVRMAVMQSQSRWAFLGLRQSKGDGSRSQKSQETSILHFWFVWEEVTVNVQWNMC